jgi:hypothetical protein
MSVRMSVGSSGPTGLTMENRAFYFPSIGNTNMADMVRVDQARSDWAKLR